VGVGFCAVDFGLPVRVIYQKCGLANAGILVVRWSFIFARSGNWFGKTLLRPFLAHATERQTAGTRPFRVELAVLFLAPIFRGRGSRKGRLT